MASPVTVSRIQNRRGTQTQFDALYPGQYTSAPGATSSGAIITVSSTTGIYTLARPQIVAGTGAFAPGTYVVSVDSPTTFTVNFVPTVALSAGAQIVIPTYNGTGGLLTSEFPNIMMPGELALITDTRRIFIGNLNGEYIELDTSIGGGILLEPLVIQLPPAAVFTPIPQLDYLPTPFFTLLYDITDSLSPDQNVVGTTFSRNGEMKITAVTDFGPGSVSLSDTSIDVNTTLFDISFSADYNGPVIEISYMHNFLGNLTLSSSTILWLPF